MSMQQQRWQDGPRNAEDRSKVARPNAPAPPGESRMISVQKGELSLMPAFERLLHVGEEDVQWWISPGKKRTRGRARGAAPVVCINSNDPEPMMTLAQVAAWFHKSQAWVRAHALGRNRPQLPCVPIGRTLLFEREKIQEWLRRARIAA